MYFSMIYVLILKMTAAILTGAAAVCNSIHLFITEDWPEIKEVTGKAIQTGAEVMSMYIDLARVAGRTAGYAAATITAVIS